MTETTQVNHELAMAAEAERRALTGQAMREHESNVLAEIRRFRAELDHINMVCDLRTTTRNGGAQ